MRVAVTNDFGGPGPRLKCLDSILPLEPTAVMGVLNVTPDSFSDGGLWNEPKAAIEHGMEMMDEGAAIIDVGGESTRPGAEPVPLDEELRRVIPVIEGLASGGVEFISVDTRKAEVARSAVEAGAKIVNDTLGEESDGSIDAVAAETGAGIIVMHSRGTPATMRSLTDYDDVSKHVEAFFDKRGRELEDIGVNRESIVVDPGIGFAKTAQQSVKLLENISYLTTDLYPVLIGASRKSFMGQILDLEEGQRLEATLATTAWVTLQGVAIVRVHDVKENVRVIRTITTIVNFDREP